MKPRTLGHWVSLLAVALGLAGCTTIRDVYPQFPDQSAGLKSVAITSDVLVLEDVRGSLPLVDLPRIADLAAELNAYFQTEFEKRGIAVVQAESAAIGLRYSYAVPPPFKIRTADDDPEKPIAELTTGPAPYWIAPRYTDPERRGHLINTLEDMHRKRIAPGMTNLTSAAGRQLGPIDGATHRVFVLVEGVQVPMGKGLLQAVGTGLLTLGTVAVFEMTTVQFRVGIMDGSNGEFIFICDCSIAGGWTIDPGYLRRQAGIFFAQLDHLRAKS